MTKAEECRIRTEALKFAIEAAERFAMTVNYGRRVINRDEWENYLEREIISMRLRVAQAPGAQA